MRWKSVVIGGVGLAVSLPVLVFFVWAFQCVLGLTREHDLGDSSQASSPPSSAARSGGGFQQPLQSGTPQVDSPFGSPPPGWQRTTRGLGRAARAAVSNEIQAAMGSLRSRLAACPDAPRTSVTELQAKAVELVRQAIASGGDGDIGPLELANELARSKGSEAPPIMMLDVETFDSQVKIIDAVLAMPGSASEAFASCAQRLLRGQILFVQSAPGGQHLRIPVDLSPGALDGQPPRLSSRRRR